MAALCSYYEYVVYHSNGFEVDTEKQRQPRHDTRLTVSGNSRREQLVMVPTKSLTNREWLPGELLSGSVCRRPGWFLEMKYQTCLTITFTVHVQMLSPPLLYSRQPCESSPQVLVVDC